jgi:DNA-binding LytR/AlgR family response regulator
MKAIVIEDEPLAQAKLVSMLRSVDASIDVVATLGSVKDSIWWLQHHESPDIAFVDIQLSDNHSFEIFRQLQVNFPVIFTTAFDKYLLESFEFNSIDYVLKPVTEEKLLRSLEKVKTLKKHFLQSAIHDFVSQTKAPARKRIVGKKGADFVALDLEEVAYLYSEQKMVFVRDFSGNQFILDKNLAEWESLLDRNDFFRLNRKFIAHRKSIERFKADNGKIRVYLKPVVKEEVHVSKETAPEFRDWIGG